MAEGPGGNGPMADKISSASSLQEAPSPVSSVTAGAAEGRSAGRDAELERLRKIEANYEHDKAALAKEKAPALARSASHEVGHAEEGGEGETENLQKIALLQQRSIARELRRREGV
jgi:hypothetical protein